MNTINWTRKAVKQLKKLPQQEKTQIAEAVMVLEDFSTAPNIKALTNHKYDYRLRVGRYRVMFDYHNIVKIVSIEEVKKRDDNTY